MKIIGLGNDYVNQQLLENANKEGRNAEIGVSGGDNSGNDFGTTKGIGKDEKPAPKVEAQAKKEKASKSKRKKERG